MNDVEVLHDIGTALDPSRAEPPGHLRDRVLGELADASPRRVRLPRFGWRLAATGGLAVAMAAALIGVQVVGFGDREPRSAEAAEILENAALVAERTAAVNPRPDQFVYVESATAYGGSTGSTDGEGTATGWAITEKLRRVWLSVDGTRNGLLRERPESDPKGWSETPLPGCVGGRLNKVPGEGKAAEDQEQGCQPLPGYLGGLPTDTDAMYDYLYRNSHGGKPADHQAFTTVGDLVRENYVPPKAMAAMFRAAARIPGTTVVRNVTDPAGRPGIAVAYTARGLQRELIFDPKTFAYLGEREVAAEDIDIARKGAVIGGAARLTAAVVDQPGRLS